MRTPRGNGAVDLTVVAVPFYFGAMALEHRALKRRRAVEGPSAGDYERRDTLASLSMGVASLVAPLVMPRLLGPVTPGKGRWGRALVAAAVGGAAVVTVADLVARRAEIAASEAGTVPRLAAPREPRAGPAGCDGLRAGSGRGAAVAVRPPGPHLPDRPPAWPGRRPSPRWPPA